MGVGDKIEKFREQWPEFREWQASQPGNWRSAVMWWSLAIAFFISFGVHDPWWVHVMIFGTLIGFDIWWWCRALHRYRERDRTAVYGRSDIKGRWW